MAEEKAKDENGAAKAEHKPPAGAEITAAWTAGAISIDYTASAVAAIASAPFFAHLDLFCAMSVTPLIA